MHIVFFGTSEFAVPALELLARSNAPAAVITQPARPQGRGLKEQPGPVESKARERGLEVSAPADPNDPAFISGLKALAPDLAVLVAYGCILHQELLDVPRLGFVNLHPSLLPLYRGAAPIQRALMAGDTETGVSVIRMCRKVDSGPILAQDRIAVDPDENAAELGARLARLGAELLARAVDAVASGKAEPKAQDDSLATPAPKLANEERAIDWRLPALRLHNLIRAFAPRPAATCSFRAERVLVLRSRVVSTDAAAQPGEPLLDRPGLVVGTGQGLLELVELRPQAGKTQSGQSFRNGRRLRPEEKFN